MQSQAFTLEKSFENDRGTYNAIDYKAFVLIINHVLRLNKYLLKIQSKHLRSFFSSKNYELFTSFIFLQTSLF